MRPQPPLCEYGGCSEQDGSVNRLQSCPCVKARDGYEYEKDKLGIAGLTGIDSEPVGRQRVLECPVQLEAVLVESRPFGAIDYARPFSDHPQPGPLADACEVRIVRAHIDDSILIPGMKNRVDDEKWHALITCFSQLHGVGGRIQHPKLADIPRSFTVPLKPWASRHEFDSKKRSVVSGEAR